MIRDLLNDLRCRHPIRRVAQRIRFCWHAARGASDDLNRRVDAENSLARAAMGMREPPDQRECGEIAHKLGVPSEHRIGDGS